MSIDKLIYVGLGGFIGACIREIIAVYVPKLLGNEFPYQTLIVNVLGGFLIGLIVEISLGTDLISQDLKLFLTTGVMGGLTTFSTFSLETVQLLSSKSYLLGGVNILSNVLLSILGVVIGEFIVKNIYLSI